MEVRQFSKRPLTVDAFRFNADEAQKRLTPGSSEIKVGLATFWREHDGVWKVYNPGRVVTLEGPWQRVHDGDYVIVAPTGCRYPVQADQFERNYAEMSQVDERAPKAA